MTNPVHIDLNDLTDAHVEEALPHMGQCEYSSPCIIGTLVPESMRGLLDSPMGFPADTEIDNLVRQGLVTMPDGQVHLAKALQESFDTDSKEEFLVQLEAVRRELAKMAA